MGRGSSEEPGGEWPMALWRRDLRGEPEEDLEVVGVVQGWGSGTRALVVGMEEGVWEKRTGRREPGGGILKHLSQQ